MQRSIHSPVLVSFARFAVLVCLLIGCASAAWSFDGEAAGAPRSTQIVEVDGVAPVTGDANADKKLAIENGESLAVQQVLDRLVSWREAKRYIKTYRLIEAGADGKQWTVTLRVTVSKTPVALAPDNYRIMVIVPETLLDHPRVPDPAGETRLIQRLVEAGFNVLDASDIEAIRYTDDVGRIYKEADVKAIKALGAKFKCDLLITGEAIAEDAGTTAGGFRSARARIETKVFIVDTGKILVSHDATAGGADLTPAIAAKTALRNAAEKDCEYLVPELRRCMDNFTPIFTITVGSVYSASILDDLETELEKLPDVGPDKVRRRNYDAVTGTATLDVETPLHMLQLSKALATLDGPAVAVKSSTGQELEIGIIQPR